MPFMWDGFNFLFLLVLIIIITILNTKYYNIHIKKSTNKDSSAKRRQIYQSVVYCIALFLKALLNIITSAGSVFKSDDEINSSYIFIVIHECILIMPIAISYSIYLK